MKDRAFYQPTLPRWLRTSWHPDEIVKFGVGTFSCISSFLNTSVMNYFKNRARDLSLADSDVFWGNNLASRYISVKPADTICIGILIMSTIYLVNQSFFSFLVTMWCCAKCQNVTCDEKL